MNDQTLLEVVDILTKEKPDIFDTHKVKQEYFLDYNKHQIKWLMVEQYYLGEQLKHDPTNTELLNDIRQRHTCERFKIYYTLKYYDRMEKLE